MKINVVTLCSGYGAQELALERLKRDFPQFDYEVLAWSEIDAYACAAYKALRPEYADRNLGDMTKADYSAIKGKVDLLFYSTPCQSVSTAGKQRGMKKGDDDAASALIWHAERAIRELKPNYLILENVKGMVNKRNRADFDEWCAVLESYGYKNFYQVLDSSKYGVPQHRERVFMVSICVGDSYEFPKPFPLEKRLRDVLEEEVDESYYLKDEQVERILAHCERKQEEGCGFKANFQDEGGVCGTITGNYGQRETDTYLKLDETDNSN